MDLLKEIKDYCDKDDRPVHNQIAYLKQLGLLMFMNNRLYKDHVISFCGTLVKLYKNLNNEMIEVDNESVKGMH